MSSTASDWLDFQRPLAITLGELDYGTEMHLLIEEWKRKLELERKRKRPDWDREEIRNYYGYHE